MMNHGQAEQPGGMTAHDGPVDDDQQKARTSERGEQRDDAEVPKLIGIYADDPSRAQRKRKREQYAERRHRAIGRDEKGTDVNENGIHLNKNIVSGQLCGIGSLQKGPHLSRANWTKDRIRPAGPWMMRW